MLSGVMLSEGGRSSRKSRGKSSEESSGSGDSRGTKGATEKGYTAKMVKNIVGVEQRYRRKKDETAHIFTRNGNLVTSVRGIGTDIDFQGRKIPPNSIITHNHPRALSESGIERIGNSFSRKDIIAAVDLNAAEMRAVTPTYTFSVKRPKGGWGVSVKEIAKEYDKISDAVLQSGYAYLRKIGGDESHIARANVTFQHKVMKILAKKYGWDYSKKNK